MLNKDHSIQYSYNYFVLIKFTYLGWLTYFFIFNLYAMIWRQYGTDYEYNYINSLIWFAKEWGAWLLACPVLLWFLYRPIPNTVLWTNALIVSLFSLSALIAVRCVLNDGEYPFNWVSVAVIIAPKYSVAYLMLFCGWFFLAKQSAKDTQTEAETKTNDLALNEKPALNIIHQGVAISIKPTEIFSLKAAGNYIDIECAETTYLIRMSLKDLLNQLADEGFIRVHRSYAINLTKLLRLTNNESGGGNAILSNESNIPVSKRYKSILKAKTIPRS